MSLVLQLFNGGLLKPYTLAMICISLIDHLKGSATPDRLELMSCSKANFDLIGTYFSIHWNTILENEKKSCARRGSSLWGFSVGTTGRSSLYGIFV